MKWFDAQEEAVVQFIRTPDFLYELKRCAAVFLILAVLGFGLGLAFPDSRDALLSLTPAEDVSYTAMEALNASLTTGGVAILCGALPFVYLPALTLGSNALFIGAAGAWYLAQGYSPALYLAALLPHGVFLLPVLVLCCAAGMYLCGVVTRCCRERKAGPGLLNTAYQLANLYLLLAFPILCAAALMEVYVTPRLMGLFL